MSKPAYCKQNILIPVSARSALQQGSPNARHVNISRKQHGMMSLRGEHLLRVTGNIRGSVGTADKAKAREEVVGQVGGFGPLGPRSLKPNRDGKRVADQPTGTLKEHQIVEQWDAAKEWAASQARVAARQKVFTFNFGRDGKVTCTGPYIPIIR